MLPAEARSMKNCLDALVLQNLDAASFRPRQIHAYMAGSTLCDVKVSTVQGSLQHQADNLISGVMPAFWLQSIDPSCRGDSCIAQ